MQRTIVKKTKGSAAIDGGGVHMTRVISNDTVKEFDPLLLLDSFDSKNPDDYIAGFPMHPHRGIQTVTYISQGNIKHRDSLNSEDEISSGEVQWMIAGSGILHEETFRPADRMLGVQLWLNLSKENKMVDPEYVAIKKDAIPVISGEGTQIKVLSGKYKEYKSYENQYNEFDFYDIKLDAGKELDIETNNDDSVLLFTLEYDAIICGEAIEQKTAVSTSDGDSIVLKGGEQGSNILFIKSKPLNEPIAWGGPIVMNTQTELAHAFKELRDGNFLKKQSKEHKPVKF